MTPPAGGPRGRPGERGRSRSLNCGDFKKRKIRGGGLANQRCCHVLLSCSSITLLAVNPSALQAPQGEPSWGRPLGQGAGGGNRTGLVPLGVPGVTLIHRDLSASPLSIQPQALDTDGKPSAPPHPSVESGCLEQCRGDSKEEALLEEWGGGGQRDGSSAETGPLVRRRPPGSGFLSLQSSEREKQENKLDPGLSFSPWELWTFGTSHSLGWGCPGHCGVLGGQLALASTSSMQGAPPVVVPKG